MGVQIIFSYKLTIIPKDYTPWLWNILFENEEANKYTLYHLNSVQLQYFSVFYLHFELSSPLSGAKIYFASAEWIDEM